MRVLVSGSRSGVQDLEIIRFALSLLPQSDKYVLIHGDASGVDRQFMIECKKNPDLWTIEAYRAEWNVYGRSAGPRRNQDMVNSGVDFGIFIPLEGSVGTHDCLRKYKMLKKPGIVYDYKTNSFTKF